MLSLFYRILPQVELSVDGVEVHDFGGGSSRGAIIVQERSFCTENDYVNRFIKVLKRNFEPYFALGWPLSFTMMVSLR